MIDFNKYSKTKPIAFIIKGTREEVGTYSEMAIKLFEMLYQFNPNLFERLANEKFKNPKSPLIAKNDYEILNRSKKLSNADIYIEMHHSTASFVRFMYLVLHEYGMEEDFQIITKEKNNG